MPYERRRIWIVDDSPLDADRARRALVGAYEVELFEDGSSVLERLASQRDTPDLLVVDWLMPGVSGVEVCRFLRTSGPPLSSLPVLLVTVHQRTQQLVEGLEAGANDFVSKPFAEAELRARVDSLMRMQTLVERLEQSEAMVRHLLANSPDALLAVDAEGTVFFANIEAERIFGCGADALTGRLLRELLPLPRGWSREEGAEPREDIQLGGRLYAPSFRRTGRGRAQRWVVTLRDVSREREREVRRLDFYSIVAHELRSPLSAVLLRAELLLDEDTLAPKLRADLRKMQGSLQRLSTTVNDFLELARAENAPDTIRHGRVDLMGLTEELIEEYRPLAEKHRLTLEAIAADEELAVSGDARRLKQVLDNLIGNALKFTPDGGRVTVRLERTDGEACVRVHDTGRGIKQEALPTLFERYSRAIDDEHEVVGSGLGLMIVKQTVQAHDGRLGVESKEGEGSTFWFSVPLDVASSAA